MQDREFGLIIFGATGFTGELVCQYLAEHPDTVGLSWAIAGRSLDKLDAVAKSLPGNSTPELIVADITDSDALLDMAERTSVLVSTVGPYVDYGIPVVDACVKAGTHYLDITGEPEFWFQTLREYDEAAKQKGIKLISCCGFDSIPADMGAFYTLNELGETRPASVKAYVRAKGTASGGTWASLLEAFGSARDFASQRKRDRSEASREQTEKSQKSSKPSGKSRAHLLQNLKEQFPLQRAEAVDAWVLPMPTIDPLIVKRSAKLDEQYGEGFEYDQYLQVESASEGAGLLAGVAGLFAVAQFKPAREWLKSKRPSGAGPDEEERSGNWFEVTYVGENAHERVVCQMRGGDPGYGETSKMLSECALSLVVDGDLVPDCSGVVTTASGLGWVLLARLKQAGITFETIEHEVLS